MKTSFKDLDGWLKTLVVFGWVSAGINLLYFLAGFIEGYIGY